MHSASNMMGGIVIFTIGLAGLLYLGKRAFYRRNQAGLQEFENYTKAVATTFVEGILKLVFFVMLVLGALFFLIGLIQGS